MKALLIVLLIFVSGCAINNAGDPRHRTARDLVAKQYKWLKHYDRILAKPYIENKYTCLEKASDLRSLAVSEGHYPAHVISVFTEEGLHAVVWINNPMLNNAHLVDPTNGRIVRCDSRKPEWINYYLKSEGWGRLNRIKYEVK
jgi:hypothetical protein